MIPFKKSIRRVLNAWIYEQPDPLQLPPWVSPNVWSRISAIIEGLERPRVFEYGIGCSSLGFVRMMVGKRGGRYVGIEHNLEWYASVLAALVREYSRSELLRNLGTTEVPEGGSDCLLRLGEYGGTAGTEVILRLRPASGWTVGDGNAEQFASYVASIGSESFDLITVDGRARKACVNHVLDHGNLAAGGSLILCEAGRGMSNWIGQPTCVGDSDYQSVVQRMKSLGATLYDGVGYGNWPGIPSKVRRSRGTRAVPAEICILNVKKASVLRHSPQLTTNLKIVSVVGARPQFIKAAPISRALKIAGITEYLVHTGQHYDPQMSDVFFSEMGIRASDLNLGVGSGPHGAQTAAMLEGLEKAITDQHPRWVLVYGDTNSTLAGALAAAKLQVPVAHVEAGLRSWNRRMPEEINRIVADALSTLLFVPTETARQNLLREGIPDSRIMWTGDVMYDATLLFREQANHEPGATARLGLNGKGYVLATLHRAENTDDPVRLQAILAGLRSVAEQTRVILPLHPRTRACIRKMPHFSLGAVEVIEPVGFLDMIKLESNASVIATDSGGVQKEAFFHGVPCVTMRHETEWTELIELGWNRVVRPINSREIAQAIFAARGTRGKPANPYGDGHASRRIAEALLSASSYH